MPKKTETWLYDIISSIKEIEIIFLYTLCYQHL